jgi:beta-glucosidase-like glycosyl hydrolase
MPNKNTLLFILILLALAGLTGWNYFYKPFGNWSDQLTSSTTKPSPAPQPSSTTPAQQMLANLTTKQKIAQLIAAPVTLAANSKESVAEASASAWLSENKAGFVTVFGSKITLVDAQTKIQNLKSQGELLVGTSALPLHVAVDHEGGSVQRLNGLGFRALPSWQELCARPATQSALLMASSAAQLREAGVSIVFGPVLDQSNPNSVLKNRTCHATTEVIATQTRQFIKIYRQNYITPVVKHFPGIGMAKVDLHQQFDQVTVTPEMAQLYHDILGANPTIGVMTSHVGVANQYPDIPCSLSGACVQELTASYPQVLIFTDALEMVAAGYKGVDQPLKSLPLRAREAIVSGNDVLVFGPSVNPKQLSEIIDELAKEYEINQTFQKNVNQRLEKIITFKLNN